MNISSGCFNSLRFSACNFKKKDLRKDIFLDIFFQNL